MTRTTGPSAASADSSGAGVRVHRVAATVVLLRTGTAGPEVLMLERPHGRGSFAGAWVFPGGSVDAADGITAPPGVHAGAHEEVAARRAAVREVREESGLEVAEDALVLVSRWTPPAITPKRFRTWFYYAQAPAGDIVLSPQESVGFRWIRPASALELHGAGAFELVPPTWVTLHELVDAASVDAALAWARGAQFREYATHVHGSERGPVLLWQGDVAYDDDSRFSVDGPRHRLDARTLPWTYSTSAGA